ncbi:hypothetical protein J4H86_23620 [Spiractinospora alimapuensis]|uniref:hypothetical protein n=1 Tax=Spiractinospora alimapuensis TaxID=2820884 RepID=UPI001F198E2D|nr:hypothetical protein [Spiractinospora alimapuensis]QVQ51725.1 hypothetical protein J4H86_23620 [Spiractinospora alimapuensis]
MRRVFPMIVGLSLLGVLGTGPAAAPAFADTYAAPEMTPLLVDQDDVPGDVGESDIGAIDVGADGTAVIAVPGENTVYEVDSSGEATTVIGTGQAGASDDEGPVVDTPITEPSAVARGDDGITYVADGDGAVHAVEHDQASTVISADDDVVSGEVISLATGPSALYVGTNRGEVHEVEFSGDEVTIVETYEIGGHVNGLDVGPGDEIYVAKGTAVVRVDGVTIAETLVEVGAFPSSAEFMDVAVGSDATVYAASEDGLVVVPPSAITFVRPTIRGHAVATAEGSETVVAAHENTAYQVTSSQESNPILFSSRDDVELTLPEEATAGALVALGDEIRADVSSMTIGSDGEVSVLSSEGVTNFSASRQWATITFPEEVAGAPSPSGSIVGGEHGTRFVLAGGVIHRFIEGEYQSSIPHGVAESDTFAAPPELSHMARYLDEFLVADQRRLYRMKVNGLLSPFFSDETSLDGEILALAVDQRDASVYVAVETASITTIQKIDSGGQPSDVFDGDDIPGDFTPNGMAVGPNGELYVTDQGSSRIVRYTPTLGGEPAVIAGSEEQPADPSSTEATPALETTLRSPAAPAVDAAGNLVFHANSSVYMLPNASNAPAIGGPKSMLTMSLAAVAVIGAAAGLLLVVRRKAAASGR